MQYYKSDYRIYILNIHSTIMLQRYIFILNKIHYIKKNIAVTLKGATAIFVIEFEEVFNEIHTSIYK